MDRVQTIDREKTIYNNSFQQAKNFSLTLFI